MVELAALIIIIIFAPAALVLAFYAASAAIAITTAPVWLPVAWVSEALKPSFDRLSRWRRDVLMSGWLGGTTITLRYLYGKLFAAVVIAVAGMLLMLAVASAIDLAHQYRQEAAQALEAAVIVNGHPYTLTYTDDADLAAKIALVRRDGHDITIVNDDRL